MSPNNLNTLITQNPALLVFILLWELIWKGKALWIAARKGSLYWFIALLILNTLGILPILYIFLFSKKNKQKG